MHLPLKQLMDSFLLIKTINLTTYLTVICNMTVSQVGSSLLCSTLYPYTVKDSPYKTTGWSWGYRTILQKETKKSGTHDKWWSCQKNKTYTVEHEDEERDHFFSHHLTSFHKMLAKVLSLCWPLSLGLLRVHIKHTFIKCLLLWPKH